jgi:heavy metal sensor kinase
MATVTVVRDGRQLGYAQIGLPVTERDRPLRQLLWWLIGGSLVTWGGAWVAAGYLVRQWRVPLSMLAEAARRVGIQNLSHQRLFAPADVPELAEVAQAFNELLEKLNAAHQAQQRFVADASHELRTPLAIVRGELEVALRRDRAVNEYRDTLQSCREEIERLSRLTENLLALARADVGRALGPREPVDLGTVCREVCEKLGPLAAAKRLSLEVNASETAETIGDGLALEQVVCNLVENAVRYTPAGERVTVSARNDGAEVEVTVVDTGAGIPSEHLPKIFERFYRVDKARAREIGGAGLGLAIVRTLTEAHGGRVKVESVLGQGTRFTVRLPRPPTTPA